MAHRFELNDGSDTLSFVKDFKTRLAGSLMEDSREPTKQLSPNLGDWVGCLYVVMGSRQKEVFIYSCLLALHHGLLACVSYMRFCYNMFSGFPMMFCSMCCSVVYGGHLANLARICVYIYTYVCVYICNYTV